MNLSPTHSKNVFMVVLTLFVAISFIVVFTVGVIHAEDQKCYAQYGNEIDCPVVNISFSVQKTVRKATDKDFVEQVTVGDGTNLEFRVTVKNTGDTTVSDVKLIDILPSHLTPTGATEFILNNFTPNEERVFVVTATSSTAALDPGDENCVVNVANVLYQDEKKASDTATVCIKKGQVLATKLPSTGLYDNTSIGLFIIVVVSGLIIVNSTVITEKVRKLNH